ncbi:MAG: protein kinase [Pseudomonadota bacterium]
MTPQLKIGLGQHSDKGVKADNEDFFGCEISDGPQLIHKGIVAAIADGMSSSEAGKQASQASVIGFMSDYLSAPDSWTVKHAGQKILSATNSWLFSQGHAQHESNKGMVTTLSILILKSNTGHIFHVGDSRIYRLRQGNLEQLTRDHRIWVSGHNNYLNRAMGIEPHLEVDYRNFPLEIGDTFLMTTDGVHDFIHDRSLKKLLLDYDNDPQMASEAIIAAAKPASSDNLTCQIVRIESLPLAEEGEILRKHVNRPFPPPLEPGMILDGYRIEEELHASKRTQIYRAVDTVSGKTVILKTPSVTYEDDTVYIEHFLHEEWAGKRIDHENVVKIIDDNRPRSCIYYVTEYLEGPTLRQWMNLYPTPEISTVVPLVMQIAKGLRAFLRMQMLHQDLKPENIMFDANGKLKIIDFGSVKIAGITEISPLQKQESIRGTLNYTAPEYLMGQAGTPRSDLFSLAVITYELINNALPYGRDMPEKPDRINLGKLNYVPSFHKNPMVPTWIDGAIRKSVSINPNQRHSDMFEFVHDLSHPNPMFLAQETLPLIQRNPLRLWKTLCALLAIGNLVLLYLLHKS